MNRYLKSFAACGLIAAWTPCFAQEADRIYPKTGITVTGKIVEVTRDHVVADIRGTKENYPSNTIQRIVYETEPAQLSRAKELILSDQWDDALESLKKVDTKSLLREEVKKEFLFYFGLVQSHLALQGQGDPQVAETQLLKFVQRDAQSYHFYPTSDALGTLAMATGAYDKASKYFAAMASAPFPEYKIKAQYMLGVATLALGKVTEARAAFDAASSISADNAEAKRYRKMSQLGLLRCDSADKKVDEAIKNLRVMVSENDATDSQLFAQIYNALGDAHRQAGQEEEALLAYLHTDLLFTSEPDSHAEALYYLSQLFLKTDPQRAADAKSRLQSLYTNSAWAKK
ncbi:MAG: hypothetical protein SGI77_08340 [Pirellulaceae bacterium]|nr:hypothetical protein [Pirellulaceae bacterium]